MATEYKLSYTGAEIDEKLGKIDNIANQILDPDSHPLDTSDDTIKAEHKKIYIADHGYSIYGDIIDDETTHKIVIEAEGKDDNPYNVLELKAPSANPREATFTLMNWGNEHKQFVDFSSMTYDELAPTAEIVCQSRNNKPLPEFSIRYNDGQGAGRVKKFVVNPDAIPVHLTNKGFKVRKNNTYDNNTNSAEYVTVNLANLAETVNALNIEGGAVKSYILDEARRVSDIAHKARTSDSFVFAALADCHYGVNDETQAAINHTAQALCEIKKNISLDAIALLGDFVRGNDTDTREDCNNTLVEIRRIFYKAVENVPSFWTAGNHDNAHYYTRDDETDRTDGDTMYSYLGSNNRDMVLDSNNRHRMYGYRDFDYQKIRVIYLNTADVSDNATSGSCKITTTQLNWLASSGLDFSDKDDATEWGVIFLSHHPLDWSNDDTKPAIDVINDYINKTGSFANATHFAEIIAAFHGHTHNYIAHSISDGEFPSISIPQVCFGRYNEYATDPDKSAEFGEFMADGITPIYHNKTADSAQETSFNIIVIDRKTKKIYCTNYGAGKDRVYNFTGSVDPSAPVVITPELEVGRLSVNNGGIRDDTTDMIRTKNYIECEENSTYMFNTNGYWWCLFFYDENKTFLTNWSADDESYKYIADATYTVPANAKYMKLFCEDTGDISNTIIIQRVS